MNDFTKDELQDILYFVNRYHEISEFYKPREIIDKLESMIANYCEHKNVYEDSNWFVGCLDCDRKLE